MIDVSPAVLLALLGWGVIVGVDLVSLPQVMLSRPVVAGPVAGWLLGDVESGLRIGVLFELFALDVLPVGAVRYPDYGPATVAATALAAGLPWELGLGPGALLGLLVAATGGWSLQRLRQQNTRAVEARTAALAAGDGHVVRALQWGGIARDVLRSLALTALGLAAAWVAARELTLDLGTASALALAAIGAALAAALGGAMRVAGRGRRLAWLLAGLGGGVVAAVLR